MKDDRVLVGLSGGVDSAVTVRILQQQGFIVEGAVIVFSPAHTPAVEAARLAAQELDIPLAELHCEALFDTEVILPFCHAYANGRTPNPCILCNPAVKFRVLMEEADRRGIRYIASGHYARTEDRDGIPHIAQALSAARDQSYMLYRLPQACRERLCLPLGEFEKEDIRAMAQAFGLSCASAPDSQEICFIPEGHYADYIEKRGIESKCGVFIAPDGTNMGAHQGVLHYTVGQRRGLGIALGKPVFVKAILPDGNIQLAYAGEEYAQSITLQNCVTATGAALPEDVRYRVKIRSMAKPVPCAIRKTTPDGGDITLVFDEPQRAPAPGQHAVLYDGPYVVGGGEIDCFCQAENPPPMINEKSPT